MGYVSNKFMIVHTWDEETARIARHAAVEVFGEKLVGPLMTSTVNGEDGFIVWTIGSKEGWDEEGRHDESIERLIGALSKLERPPRWCIVRSGEEVGDLSAEHGYDGDYAHRYKRHKVGVRR